MLELLDNVKRMLNDGVRIKPGQNLLVISDNYARSKVIANAFTDAAIAMGVHAILMVIEPLSHIGQEPPPAVSAAMKASDVIIELGERSTAGHSNARMEAKKAGAQYFLMHTDVSEDYLRTPISRDDLNTMKIQTEKLANMMTRAKASRIITAFGTDISMSLVNRQAIAICPLVDNSHRSLLDYAEAAISPVEGTTEGVVIADASVRGWEHALRTPIHFEVKKGRALINTVTCDSNEEAENFKKILMLDENATNCAAELGLGTNHIVPRYLRGDAMRDYAMAGNVHIAVGRNNDIGGETWSKVHTDVLMTRATVVLDGVTVIENGELKI